MTLLEKTPENGDERLKESGKCDFFLVEMVL